ncbi:MAG TPA: CPBP family intramembrane glutamic endopeptidase [Flavipsychrobacter sp.]|nr:CPBP family intramembrane glutamic endopeptidase [Flavipsychrobacter sp.]
MKKLVTFFVLAYTISWVIWMPLWLPALGIANLPVVPFNHAIGGLGPMIAAFIVTYAERKNEGVQHLLKAMFSFKAILYIAVALLSPFLMLWLAGVADYMIAGNSFDWKGFTKSREFPDFSFVTFLLYNLVFFGYGEEVGWRGYALPKLQQRYKPVKAALVLTVFWIIWHWPLFLYRQGYTEMGIGGIVGWIFSMLTGSVLLSWMFNASKGSILVVAIFHATIDIAFTADMANANIVNYAGAIITIWGIAMLLVLRKQRAVTALP